MSRARRGSLCVVLGSALYRKCGMVEVDVGCGEKNATEGAFVSRVERGGGLRERAMSGGGALEEQKGEGLAQESAGSVVGGARVVVITGMSGSGKSTAMRALEDAGFFCIDNLPVPLLPRVLELTAARGAGEGSLPKLYAFVVDTREREFLPQAGAIIGQLRAEGVAVQVIFLEASDDVLMQRYSETRRRHPLSDGGTVRDGIERERALLAPLRELSNAMVDTTQHTVHTLKALVQSLVSEVSESSLVVTVLTFGFKYGLPSECDLVWDVRFLPNPYFDLSLRDKTGLDREVSHFVMGHVEAERFVELVMQQLDYTLPLYVREGKTYLTMGIGCTGGKHRSVTLGEVLGGLLRSRGVRVMVRHRDRLRTSSQYEM